MSPPPAEQTAPSGTKPRYGLRLLGVCLVGAGLVAACLPWPVASPRLVAMVADELARSYGIALTIEGAADVALLPFPRVNVATVRLAAGTPDGAVLAEGGSLSLQLSLLSLMSGRIDVHALSLDGAAVTLPMDATDRRWAAPAQHIVRRIGTGGEAQRPRLGLTRATVTGWNPRDGTIETVRDVDLTLSAPLWGTSAELAARGTWRGQEARLRVTGLELPDLLGGRATPFSATAAWAAGTLVAKGTARFGDTCCEVSGRATLATRSLPETLGWTGGGVALAPLIEEVAVEAEFRIAGKDLLLPLMRVTLGGNRLEGAGSVSFADDRPAIQATLAADSLNVAPLVGDLIGALGLGPDAPGWEGRPFVLAPFTAGDLDLRLSAASARIGPVLVEDVASSLIVREGGVEASLGRASLRGGTVKGRVVLGEMPDPRVTQVRAQGAFDGLDLGALMIDVGEDRWLVGAVNGTFAMESRASTMGELVGRLGGRAAVAVEGGALTGLDLAAVMARDRAGPAGLPVQRIGRTDFARAGLALRFKDGVGAVTEGTLAAPDLSASLAGTISLPDRRVEARAELARSGNPGPARLFEIVGPWSAVAVRAMAAGARPADPNGLAIMRPDMLRMPASARAYAP